MSLDRAVDGSVVVRSARGVGARLRRWLGPILRPLAAADRRVLDWVRAARVYHWLTTGDDSNPTRIDLRGGRRAAPFDSITAATANAHVLAVAQVAADRVATAPARAFGALLVLGVGSSLLATLAGGSPSPFVLWFHALGLLAGAAGLREGRDLAGLAESAVWGPLLALVAPPHGEREDDA